MPIDRNASSSSIPSASAPIGSIADLLSQARMFLSRNRRLVLGTTLAGGVFCAILAVSMDSRYSSTLQLAIDEPLRRFEDTNEMASRELLAFVDGQIHILNSRDIMQQVADVAGLENEEEYRRPPDSWLKVLASQLKALFESADADKSDLPAGLAKESYSVRTLRRNVSISRRGETNVISISVDSTSPVLAARIAGVIGEVFDADRRKAQRLRAERLTSVVDERVLELRQKLSDAEDAVATYRIEYDLITGTPDTTLSEQQLVELNAELIRTRAALSEKRATFARAKQLLEDDGDIQALPPVQGSEIVTELRTRLLDLQLREIGMRRLSSNDPRLAAITDERAEVEIRLGEEIKRTVTMIGHEVETLEARAALVSDALSEAEGRSGVENRNVVKLRELERVVQAYQALYERYLSNAGIADEAMGVMSSGVEIVETPVVAGSPDFPPTKLLVIWGLIFGGAIGVTIAFLRETMQRGFTTSSQAETVLGVPVAALVPRKPAGATLSRIVLDHPAQPGAQAVRGLRLALTEGAPAVAGRANKVMLSAVGDVENSRDLARALAISAAQAGLSVLLIDPLPAGQRQQIDTLPEGTAGLSEALKTEQVQVIHHLDSLPGVDILPAGQAENPANLLSGSAMREYLARVEQDYDLILILGPSLPGAVDTPYLARMVDQTVVVLRWKDTERDTATAAIERLSGASGVVVAMTDVDAPTAGHYGETRLIDAPA